MFRAGQLVRLNPEHPQILDSDLYGNSIAGCRRAPLNEQDYLNGRHLNEMPTDAIGIVVKTELSDEELLGLRRVGYLPLAQQMIVALMGEDLVYIESGMLTDIEE